jgi:hypothetical protein
MRIIRGTKQPRKAECVNDHEIVEKEYFPFIATHKGKKVLPRPSPVRVTRDPPIFLGGKEIMLLVIFNIGNFITRDLRSMN